MVRHILSLFDHARARAGTSSVPAKESDGEPLPISQLYQATLKDIQDRPFRWLQGISSGFSDVDERTGGLRKGELSLVAGRYGIGRSAFAYHVARNVSLQGIPVALAPLNTSIPSVGMRLLSTATSIPLHQLRTGTLTEAERSKIVECAHESADTPLVICNYPGAGIEDLRLAARKLKKTANRLALLIVDDLEILLNESDDPRFAMGAIARELKVIASELELHVMGVLALSWKHLPSSKDYRPRLSELSPKTKEASDLILFIHRENFEDGQAAVTVALNRKGNTGRILVRFHPDTASMTTY
jgi:replicative DNA helicase